MSPLRGYMGSLGTMAVLVVGVVVLFAVVNGVFAFKDWTGSPARGAAADLSVRGALAGVDGPAQVALDAAAAAGAIGAAPAVAPDAVAPGIPGAGASGGPGAGASGGQSAPLSNRTVPNSSRPETGGGRSVPRPVRQPPAGPGAEAPRGPAETGAGAVEGLTNQLGQTVAGVNPQLGQTVTDTGHALGELVRGVAP